MGVRTGARTETGELRPRDLHQHKIKRQQRQRHPRLWIPTPRPQSIPSGFDPPLLIIARCRPCSQCLRSTTVPPSIQTVARRRGSRSRLRLVAFRVRLRRADWPYREHIAPNHSHHNSYPPHKTTYKRLLIPRSREGVRLQVVIYSFLRG